MSDLIYIDKNTFDDSIANIKEKLNITQSLSLKNLLQYIEVSADLNPITLSYGTVTIGSGISANSETKATASQVTINHNLNYTPSHVLFMKLGGLRGSVRNSSVTSSSSSNYYHSYTERFAGYANVNNTKYYNYQVSQSSQYSGNSYIPKATPSIQSATLSDTTAQISNITNVSFKLPTGLIVGSTYLWVVI